MQAIFLSFRMGCAARVAGEDFVGPMDQERFALRPLMPR
jgi:hypothetical protein